MIILLAGLVIKLAGLTTTQAGMIRIRLGCYDRPDKQKMNFRSLSGWKFALGWFSENNSQYHVGNYSLGWR